MLPQFMPRPLPTILAVLAAACAAASSDDRGPDPLTRGITAIDSGRSAEGIAALEHALSSAALSSAERARAHAYAGHAWTLLRDPARALSHYEQGRREDPGDAWLCYASGVALRDLGRSAEAIAAFSAAIAREPRHLKALQWRADLLLERENAEAALADLERVLALLDEADPAVLSAWGGVPWDLRVWTLHRSALCRGALGDAAGANRDLAEKARLEDERRLGAEDASSVDGR
jgi:tetratricopeptide (TPR) repeat protein